MITFSVPTCPFKLIGERPRIRYISSGRKSFSNFGVGDEDNDPTTFLAIKGKYKIYVFST